jgi:type IV pilus assembly protein PilB
MGDGVMIDGLFSPAADAVADRRDAATDRLPVIADTQQLGAYLAAYAAGDVARALPALQTDAPTWAGLAGDDGGAAWDLARQIGIPLVALDGVPARPDAVALLPAATARRLRAVPLLRARGLVAVAVDAGTDADALAALDFVSRERVVPVVATERAIREAIGRHYDHIEDSEIARTLGLDPSASGEGSVAEFERLAREKPVVGIIQAMIAEAVARRASDIHLRPGEHALELLYRIDDDMVPVRRFMRVLAPALVSRIKVLGGMNIAEHRLPQDGRTTFTLDSGRQVDLRVSVLPTVFGESVVVRLLDTDESLKTLDQIGLTPEDRQRLDDLMNRSHGMFLTTGPTGCGKSTTLYAMLLEMRRQRINILTVEDPVEFHIEDLQQMQVNRAAGFTFANALRNFLRHDPDVIMVGEIRDHETADIAIESALTGHLVLSTLHTNTAATTITRLLDLGVEAFLLRSSLLAVMAQRLVRQTCANCAMPEEPSEHLRSVMDVGPDEAFTIGRGCHACNGLGVFRRSAVYELMEITPALRRLIVPGAEADRIHEAALAEGMVPITRHALQMARAGRISLAEAYRVRTD